MLHAQHLLLHESCCAAIMHHHALLLSLLRLNAWRPASFTVVQAGADPNNQSAGHRETGVHIAAR
jgi:hypothetical protein